MAAKPVIGVNVDYRSSRKDSPAYCFLPAGYCNAISKAGAIPVLIPPSCDDADLRQLVGSLSGLVMIGGADLDCRRDGYMLHPSMRLLDTHREDFDRRLIQAAAKHRLPFMGIGCGMQLLNVSLGGTLFLHIAEDLPKAIPHLDSTDPSHRHALEIERGTLMERVFGEGEIRVNSMHHMAIDDVAPGFAITARCPDGVVEAIESTQDAWFAFGTQFHPEHESASALDLRIFEEFIAGITGETITVDDNLLMVA